MKNPKESEPIKIEEKPKYASYFDDKKVTPKGILPLPTKRDFKPIRKTDSDVPEMFYTAKENVSPHDFDYLLNPYEFCTDVDEGKVFLLILMTISRVFLFSTDLTQQQHKFKKFHSKPILG